MNSKNIKKHLNAKLKDWLESIEDDSVKTIIKNNTIITGGALVSLLTGEKVHDYDVYFRTKDACLAVAKYYVERWNDAHDDHVSVVEEEDTGRIKVFIQSKGVVEEKSLSRMDSLLLTHLIPFPPIDEDDKTDEQKAAEKDAAESKDKPKYRPVFLSSNAITLSDKVQVVVRFYGEVEEIHKNYDFAHCTCSWTSWDNEVQLPTKALECIINKELYYIGSKYPLCSIIRTRKYINRGYHINAGQFVKMAFQLNELNLYDLKTLEDQLTGVDSGYFLMMIEALRRRANEKGEAAVDRSYVFELINRMF